MEESSFDIHEKKFPLDMRVLTDALSVLFNVHDVQATKPLENIQEFYERYSSKEFLKLFADSLISSLYSHDEKRNGGMHTVDASISNLEFEEFLKKFSIDTDTLRWLSEKSDKDRAYIVNAMEYFIRRKKNEETISRMFEEARASAVVSAAKYLTELIGILYIYRPNYYKLDKLHPEDPKDVEFAKLMTDVALWDASRYVKKTKLAGTLGMSKNQLASEITELVKDRSDVLELIDNGKNFGDMPIETLVAIYTSLGLVNNPSHKEVLEAIRKHFGYNFMYLLSNISPSIIALLIKSLTIAEKDGELSCYEKKLKELAEEYIEYPKLFTFEVYKLLWGGYIKR